MRLDNRILTRRDTTVTVAKQETVRRLTSAATRPIVHEVTATILHRAVCFVMCHCRFCGVNAVAWRESATTHIYSVIFVHPFTADKASCRGHRGAHLSPQMTGHDIDSFYCKLTRSNTSCRSVLDGCSKLNFFSNFVHHFLPVYDVCVLTHS